MVEFWAEKRVVIASNPEALATSVASRLLSRVVKRTERGKTVHLSLTGGSMGGAVLAAAALDPRVATIDWSRVHFWWSDERFLSGSDPERNDRQSRVALLDSIAVPSENIHAAPSSDDGLSLDEAAERYADELLRFGAPDQPWPRFDVCFLGVGPDAHIASLFPDRPEIQITDRSVVAVRDSPKPPPDRITMTRPVINSAERVWMVLAGPDKAAALGLALAGASYESVPAAGAKGRKRTIFFVDEAAAEQVPPELIDRDY
ncbi:6-phosphogluconolactonase [Microbacterium sp. SLBN-146]|uniref:6-phosphogluconolactonase n=1 Tax=Microbacterium sp. SLBN-146 TaxID=2768457 RepID=UPI00114FF026|nr:6-phosphogluconolactonase [Microbacterium sp. SLBN-146]TQJ32310.1 6-phosphogluconolactonase [Microbacterium sp. SLBN-146]